MLNHPNRKPEYYFDKQLQRPGVSGGLVYWIVASIACAIVAALVWIGACQ